MINGEASDCSSRASLDTSRFRIGTTRDERVLGVPFVTSSSNTRARSKHRKRAAPRRERGLLDLDDTTGAFQLLLYLIGFLFTDAFLHGGWSALD